MNKQRVVMAMSGGVDSSVSAALLKEQGYEVIGVYILGWQGEPDFPCPWQKEAADAEAVAKQLGIPFYVINLSKEYEQEVIQRFFAGYQAGLTPNPDILCNREIKFKALWAAIRQFEPDFLATGHYARLRREFPSSNFQFTNKDKSKKLKTENSKIENSHPAIFKARDVNKDQTYFLWGVDRSMLPNILFPIGDLEKSAVRELAKKFKLPTAAKKDSQGICFIGPLKVRQFLNRHITAQPGEAVLADGRVIAKHQGVQFYTIGQRLAPGSVRWTGDAPPLYVIAKDSINNRLIVGHDRETLASRLIANQPNWLVDRPSKFECLAKIRYRQEDVSVEVRQTDRGVEVEFSEPVRAVTPGQSIVFFARTGELLGGAIITEVPEAEELVKSLDGRRFRSKTSPVSR